MTDSMRDRLRDELAGWPIGSGYYSTTVSVDDARDMADAVLDLIAEQQAERDKLLAKLAKVREYAEAMVSNDMSGWDFPAKLVGDGYAHCARDILTILDGGSDDE